MTEDLPRLLDLQAVAQMWSVSPHTVRKWVKQGKLQPTRLCRRLLFHPGECARFSAAQNEQDKPLVEP